jgi:hypothetical protein
MERESEVSRNILQKLAGVGAVDIGVASQFGAEADSMLFIAHE